MISMNSLLFALVYLCVWGLILYILWWALGKIAPPEPFMKIGTVILVVITVIVLINLLMGFIGTPLFSWGGIRR